MSENTDSMEPTMLLRSLAAASLGVAILLQVAAPSGAVTLIAEDFNAGPAGLATNIDVPSFTVTSGNVDVVGSSSASSVFDLYPGNGYYVDLNGTTPGVLTSSVFTFNPGDTVTLSFSYGANGVNRSATVELGALLSPETINTSQASSFSLFDRTFVVGSTTTASLVFSAVNGGNEGIIIDNVSLTTTPVPEPDMLPALLTLGAVGGALVLRRKQSAEQA
jgi:hypothetical protein